MLRHSPIRMTLAAAALLLPFCALRAQFPANTPTSGTASSVQSPKSGQRADVTYTDGLLKISANNSSLNGILRDVARLTGMKITGGVQEDKVFGTYGPAPASQVLSSLLDGSSSNVIIVQNALAGPAELILTPRRGGPTPPNPNAASANSVDYDTQPRYQPRPPEPPPQASVPTPQPQEGLPPSNGGQTGTAPDSNANAVPTALPSVDQTTTQPTTTTADPNNPNNTNTGPATPQQIFEQLQKLRQQQQQPAPQ